MRYRVNLHPWLYTSENILESARLQLIWQTTIITQHTATNDLSNIPFWLWDHSWHFVHLGQRRNPMRWQMLFFYSESARLWWWVFTSVNPTCGLLPTTDRFLDQRGLKAVSSAHSHTVFLISAASLHALPLTLTVLFMLCHIYKSLSSLTLWNFDPARH